MRARDTVTARPPASPGRCAPRGRASGAPAPFAVPAAMGRSDASLPRDSPAAGRAGRCGQATARCGAAARSVGASVEPLGSTLAFVLLVILVMLLVWRALSFT
jgi:hypothetical protein